MCDCLKLNLGSFCHFDDERLARAASATPRAHGDRATKEELYHRAQARHIPGRSKMTKRQLENALH